MRNPLRTNVLPGMTEPAGADNRDNPVHGDIIVSRASYDYDGFLLPRARCREKNERARDPTRTPSPTGRVRRDTGYSIHARPRRALRAPRLAGARVELEARACTGAAVGCAVRRGGRTPRVRRGAGAAAGCRRVGV